jgi:heme A synthase
VIDGSAPVIIGDGYAPRFRWAIFKEICLSRLAKYAWMVLAVNILVILWGVYVRASGSGAGCGSHWPLCNGEVIPLSPQIETTIEFVHRLTSGVALILVLGLFVYTRRSLISGHPARVGATWAVIFIVIESLIGAGLVLFKLVADNDSIGRVVFISVHLVNTFLLLASITLTAWWASGGKPIQIGKNWLLNYALGIGFAGIILLGLTGAITALGDTLFPAESLIQGIQQDFSPTAHFLVRLRVWHPVLAIITGLYLGFTVVLTASFLSDRVVWIFTWIFLGLFGTQLVAGLVNLLLLAPIPMQIIHLLLADLVWLTLVLFTASVYKRDLASEVVITGDAQ